MNGIGRVRVLFALFGLIGMHGAVLAEPLFDEIDNAIAAADYNRALALINTELATAPGDVQLRFRRARPSVPPRMPVSVL